MGSWSAHIDAEQERIAGALERLGFKAAPVGFGVAAYDGDVLWMVQPHNLKTCECGVYRYLPGKISTCPACGKPLA